MNNLLEDYFTESVLQHPDRVALESYGLKFSYSEFNFVVQRIACSLREQNIRNKAVIVLNEHSVFSYAGILAINFTDNAILPIEQSWPQYRIIAILKEVKPAAIIVSFLNEEIQCFVSEIKELSDCIIIEAGTGTINNTLDRSKELLIPDYNEIAYIIFTSGSTGKPKGVPVKNESLYAFLHYYKENYDFTCEDRFLQVYDITFDVAYFSFLMPLCCGACCCVVNTQKGIPKYLFIINDLLNQNISVVSMVPTILAFIKKYFKGHEAASVRYSFFSGDALHYTDLIEWQKFVPKAAIHNFYGPTETTIVCTRYVWEKHRSVSEIHNDIIPLGTPFPGMKFQIVDSENNEIRAGEVGELAFSGVQVIDSYLNNRHNEKFFITLNNGLREVFYKTGDLASLNEVGNLVFHGRIDNQVKINGYRIELEEVRLALQKVTQKNCVVIRKRNEKNVDFLKAFVEGESLDIESIKDRLYDYLPEYMVPQQIAFISQIPLLENNKINTQYLQNV